MISDVQANWQDRKGIVINYICILGRTKLSVSENNCSPNITSRNNGGGYYGFIISLYVNFTGCLFDSRSSKFWLADI